MSDNICAVFYINKLGGTHSSQMSLLALDIWNTLFNTILHILHATYLVVKDIMQTGYPDHLVILIMILA